MARTTDIGLRRDPHPPIPIVMPSRSSATTSSSVHRLSATFPSRVEVRVESPSAPQAIGHDLPGSSPTSLPRTPRATTSTTFRAVRLGVMPPPQGRFLSTPDLVGEYARAAEAAGFESIWAFEHAVIPADYASRYPYNPEGRITIEDDDIPDPFALLAFFAGVTERINLGTGVLILPQRSPVVCAKECATVDALSLGRLRLGIGVGWLREEAEAVGASFTDRGVRTDEAIDVMRTLWAAGDATFDGRYTRFARAKSNPKPLRPEGIPILVGGHSDAAARRAGRLGDGWFPIGLRGEDFEARRATMHAAARDAGRDPDSIEITYSGPAKPDLVTRYAELGVSRWIVPAWGDSLDASRRELERVATELADL
jgi:probable F420-dependent oxidoreductase